ncbi:MAG: nucleotidyltransferase domain-containing protein [Candidatus Aenigmarchaeota archaeon]|nr:nucleotidyltransferase domain-containing protein [Candidatus Aenigmarchaeota archaeon]
MQFRNFAENLLGSKIKIKLLKYILSEEAITSEREIARLIGVSAGAVNKTLKEFHDLNLISPMRIGNVIAWQLNEKSYAYKYLLDFFIKLKLGETPVFAIKADIKTLAHRPEIKKAILFGSVAEGREMPESDIDVFILVETEKNRKDVLFSMGNLNNSCIQKYGNELNVHIFTLKDMKNPKNKKFLENVMNGIRVIER